MRPAQLLNVTPGMRVLDLCAAPGGKAGQLAAYLQGRGLLVANEVHPGRASVLTGSLERLGVKNALITSMRPEALCKALPGYFDAVLVDAPCSGEGMFRREPQAIADWSGAHVLACAARQSRILDAAAQALKPGGKLVYATCTFSPEENEGVVRGFLAAHEDFTLIQEERHYPHTGPGEGQYAALLQKRPGSAPVYQAAPPPALPGEAHKAWSRFLQDCMRKQPEGAPALLSDGRLILLPDGLPAQYAKLHTLRAGVLAGEYRQGRIQPAHALCMASQAGDFLHTLTLNHDDLCNYFQGNILETDPNLRGFVALLAQGYPVGWGKAVNGVVKNHLPKGLR